ncbi:MAG: MFS transporter [Anaerolineales bacterium]
MDHPVARRLIVVLFAGHSLALVGSVATATVDSITSVHVSGRPELSTVPTTLYLLAAALAAYPAGRVMERYGRRVGLVSGYSLASLGGLASGGGIILRTFPLLLLGAALFGLGRAAIDQGRYAAADVVPAAARARAVSWIVLAGTLGAVLGPRMVVPTGAVAGRFGIDELAGPYFAAALLLLAGGILIAVALRPDPRDFGRTIAGAEQTAALAPGAGRSYRDVLRESPARLALAAMVGGLFVMIMVMVITPLHMRQHDHSLDSVSWVFVAHVLGMYAFSIPTGRVTDALGRPAAIRMGAILLIAACATASVAQTVAALALGLFLLGLGWNLCYVAGSSLLTDILRPAERARIQGSNDLLVGLTAAAGSLGAGQLFAWVGYPSMAWIGAAIAAGLLIYSFANGRTAAWRAAPAD